MITHVLNYFCLMHKTFFKELVRFACQYVLAVPQGICTLLSIFLNRGTDADFCGWPDLQSAVEHVVSPGACRREGRCTQTV